MHASLQQARQVLAEQAFSALLGTELLDYQRGKATLRLKVNDDLRQQYGFVHGGVLSYLADNALAFAGGTVLEPLVFSSEFKINYLRPAGGDTLLAEATVIHAGRNQAVVRCDIYDCREEQRKLCVAAQGTIVRSPPPPN